MTFRNEVLHATGHTALDQDGMEVGLVVDVLFDSDGEPRWAVVDPGLFHRAHYAPLSGAYAANDGGIVLPVSKEVLAHAPTAKRDHALTRELENELRSYYSN